MYWDSFRFVARDLGVRYMMGGGKPSKATHLLTHFHVLYDIDSLLSYPYCNTQRTQNPPTFGSWGFNSPSRHHDYLLCFE